jgi:hypothetical protein
MMAPLADFQCLRPIAIPMTAPFRASYRAGPPIDEAGACRRVLAALDGARSAANVTGFCSAAARAVGA